MMDSNPAPIRAIFGRMDPWSLLLALVLARAGVAFSLGFHPFDDTFITFRYALNLASGHGFVFNHGERVLGTTTPLWTLVLTVFRMLGAPLPTVALVLGTLTDAVSAFLILRMLLKLGFPRRVGLAAALLFLALFDYLSIARSGMETPLFVMLALGTLAALAEGRMKTAGIVAGLTCLTRPEGLVLLPIFLVVGALRWRDRASRQGALLGGVFLAGIVGAWILFSLVYFGSPAPQSILAKVSHMENDPGLARFSWMNFVLFFLQGQYGGGIFARTWLQLNFALTFLTGLGTLGLGLRALRERSEMAWTRLAVLVLFPLGYAGGLAVSHAFTWFSWYYGPLYPFLAILAVLGLEALARAVRPAQWAALAGLAVLIVAQAAAAVAVKLPNDRDFVVTGYSRSAAEIPRQPGIRVAALEIGAVGWQVWPLPVIDLLGLVTPEATGRPPEDTLASFRPDYLCLRTDDAAPMMERLYRSGWFAATYERVSSLQDPYEPHRSFVLYRRRAATPQRSVSISWR